MTATKGLGTTGNAAGTVTPLDHKMAQLGLIAKSAPNTIRAGVFWDGNATIVSGKANMSYDVRAFAAVLSRGATAGAVLLTNDGTYNVATTAAPGSNSRYDVVYLWQREYSLDGTDSNPVIGVVQGTPAASPTVPSLAAYPGAIELARILVPSGVTATNSGTTITQKAKFTAAAGGVIPFRSATERDEDTYQEGQQGWLIDVDLLQTYSGSSWTPGVVAAQANTTVSTTGSIVAGSMSSIPTIPLTLAVTAASACRVKVVVRFQALVNAANSGFSIGVKATGATTITPTATTLDTFQHYTTATQLDYASFEWSMLLNLNACATTLEVVAQAQGAGSTRTIRNIVLRVEPVAG